MATLLFWENPARIALSRPRSSDLVTFNRDAMEVPVLLDKWRLGDLWPIFEGRWYYTYTIIFHKI